MILGGTALGGGRGTVVGTVLGVVLLGIINNGLTLRSVPYVWLFVVQGCALLLAVVIDELLSQVMTVTGGVSPDALGVVLPHEHLLVDLHRVLQPHREMKFYDVDLACHELARHAEAGGGSVVEASTPDMGRDPSRHPG